MAKIGNLDIGGRTNRVDNAIRPIQSALVCELSKPADSATLYTSEDSLWEVETKFLQRFVVARSTEVFAPEQILTLGFEQMERALDIAAYEGTVLDRLPNPSERCWILYNHQNKYYLRYVDLYLDVRKVYFEIKSVDRLGNPLPAQAEKSSEWARPLRFYRMSQSATDVFDAYRYLFLGLESMLSTIPCQKKKGEEWMVTKIRQLENGDRLKLEEIIKRPTSKTLKNLIKKHSKLRCELFHASNDFPAAHEGTVTSQKVQKSYEELILLWRAIAGVHLSLAHSRSGCVTYRAFHRDMERDLQQGVEMHYSDDPSPASQTDTEISPLGQAITQFKNVVFSAKESQGEVEFLGNLHLRDAPDSMLLRRIGMSTGGVLSLITSLTEAVSLEGIDVLEYLQKIRLLNPDLPRTDFTLSAELY